MNKDIAFAPASVMVRKEMDIRAGDTVKVYVKIEEKGKTRLQMFEGLVIATKHGKEAGATFTVRKVSNGVGIERIFALYSPAIDKIEVVKRAKVRQSKLYYIREKVTRDIRRKMRNLIAFTASTDDLVPAEAMLDETEEAKEESPVVVDLTNEESETSPVSNETENETEEDADTSESGASDDSDDSSGTSVEEESVDEVKSEK